MSTVFLSYRRRDTQADAGRLAGDLRRRHGRRFVFRDVVNISAGDKFDAVLESQLADADILLVLIGPGWLEELNNRLPQETTDYHHLELATALRERKRVIPVLLRGADLPAPLALPEDLRPITKCHAITIRDESWDSDVDRLVESIGRPYRWGLFFLRIVIAAVSITIGVWMISPQIFRERAGDYAFQRRLLLALMSVYGVFELSLGFLHRRTLKRLRQPVVSDRSI